MTRITDKVAIVTGGSTGIGAAAALHFAEAGMNVLITGRHDDTLVSSAARHGRISRLKVDIAAPDGPERTLAEVRERFGRLDVLVNNAAVGPIAPLADANREHVRTVLSTNVEGLIETTRVLLPLLREARGCVVNVATTIADEPFANLSVYCASKAAVLALTRAWAQELATDGVRVNAVSPGCIETPMFHPRKLGVTEEAAQQIATNVLGLIPSRRFGKAEEVAAVIGFLASPAASYVTGANYSVGGGLEA